MWIYLEEEYGYKIFLVFCPLSKEELSQRWESFESKGVFYFSALNFFKGIDGVIALPIVFDDHPMYGEGMFVLKQEYLSVDDKYSTMSFYEPLKGKKVDCYIHLHEDDDSCLVFGERRF